MSRHLSRRVACVLAAGAVAAATVTGASAAGERTVGAASPAAPAHGGTDAWVQRTLTGMSLRDKVGQLFVTPVNGQSANEKSPKNRKEFGVDTPAQIVQRYRVGGVIYFDNSDFDNVENPQQVARLSNGLQRAASTTGSRVPLMVSTDQEGGIVARLTGPEVTEFPGNMAMGASRETRDARRAAAITGAELRAVGINTNHAPDADVNSNPANPVIGVRSFSGDPRLTSTMTSAAVRGYQRGGDNHTVGATAKHFPGHGDAATDSHTGLPVVNRSIEEWRKIDAAPFRAAIASGADSIMSAHIVMPKLDSSGEPATLSRPILTGLLRKELGYQGVVITDSLRMQGVRDKHSDAEIPVLALKAGVDQLLMPVNLKLAIDSVMRAVRTGELTEQRIDTSVRRVLALKYKRGLAGGSNQVNVAKVPRRVGTAAHAKAAQRIADHSTTAVRNDAQLLPLRRKPRSVLVAGWGESTTQSLAGSIGKRGARVTATPTGTDPTDAQIADTVAAAKARDLTIVLTNGTTAGMREHPQQLKLIRQLAAAGKPVVAVAVQNPYDVGFVDTQKTWLATYSYSAGSMESLTKVLYGERSPHGKLPVAIPDAGDVSKTKYPFGEGLSW